MIKKKCQNNLGQNNQDEKLDLEHLTIEMSPTSGRRFYRAQRSRSTFPNYDISTVKCSKCVIKITIPHHFDVSFLIVLSRNGLSRSCAAGFQGHGPSVHIARNRHAEKLEAGGRDIH